MAHWAYCRAAATVRPFYALFVTRQGHGATVSSTGGGGR